RDRNPRALNTAGHRYYGRIESGSDSRTQSGFVPKLHAAGRRLYGKVARRKGLSFRERLRTLKGKRYWAHASGNPRSSERRDSLFNRPPLRSTGQILDGTQRSFKPAPSDRSAAESTNI